MIQALTKDRVCDSPNYPYLTAVMNNNNLFVFNKFVFILLFFQKLYLFFYFEKKSDYNIANLWRWKLRWIREKNNHFGIFWTVLYTSSSLTFFVPFLFTVVQLSNVFTLILKNYLLCMINVASYFILILTTKIENINYIVSWRQKDWFFTSYNDIGVRSHCVVMLGALI